MRKTAEPARTAVALAGVVALLGLALVVAIALSGCGPKPAPEMEIGQAFRAREVGPGFLRDPQGMSVHDIDPERDLVYLGAFGPPDGMAYTEGPKEFYRYGDGNRGSLFWFTHKVDEAYLVETTIPTPRITHEFSELYRARVIQGPLDVTTSTTGLKASDCELFPRDRLHFSAKKHYQYTEHPCTGATGLDFSRPNLVGPFYVGSGVKQIETNAYVFSFPERYAHAYLRDARIGQGRHRDGQGPSGPTVYAWRWEDPHTAPDAYSTIPAIVVLRYGDLACWEGGQQVEGDCIIDHCPDDTYRGAAFIQDGPRWALVFARRKGVSVSGDPRPGCWYGYPDGSVCPPVCDCDDCGGHRGYQAEAYIPQLVFFRPRDLAMVAEGTLDPWDPQPYAVLDLRPYMIGGDDSVDLSAVAYCPQTEVPPDDQHSGWLFVTEEWGYTSLNSAYCAVHVWEVRRH